MQDKVGAAKKRRKFASSKPENAVRKFWSIIRGCGHQLPIDLPPGIDAVVEGRDKEYIDIVDTPHEFPPKQIHTSRSAELLSRRKCQARTAADTDAACGMCDPLSTPVWTRTN